MLAAICVSVVGLWWLLYALYFSSFVQWDPEREEEKGRKLVYYKTVVFKLLRKYSV